MSSRRLHTHPSAKPGVAAQKPVAAKPPTKPNRAATSRPPTRETGKVRPPSGRLDAVSPSPHRNSAPTPVVEVSAKPANFTWRLLMLAVVGLLTVGLLTPTLRGALDQYQQFSALETEYRLALAESDRLDVELARWDDPAFIESQARTRLSYVHRGDKVWRPIGAEILAEDIDPATGLRVTQGIVGARANQPWFSALLESVKVANGPIEVEEEPENLTAILNPDD